MPENENEKWVLGWDIMPDDNVLDGITFREIIDAIHAGCKEKTYRSMRDVVKDILEQRLEDMSFLLSKNADKILEYAK